MELMQSLMSMIMTNLKYTAAQQAMHQESDVMIGHAPAITIYK
jgi:hypothetical protein